MQIAHCRYCSHEIVWCKTVTGSKMPIDPEPLEYGGNVAVLNIDSPTPLARVIRKDEEYDGPRWKSHFATCPLRPNAKKRPVAK